MKKDLEIKKEDENGAKREGRFPSIFKKLFFTPQKDQGNKIINLNRFDLMLERVKNIQSYHPSTGAHEPYGSFNYHHIIGEYSQIAGGVYLGVRPQEALLVDDEDGTLSKSCNDLLLKLTGQYGDIKAMPEQRLIEEVVEYVKQSLRYLKEEDLEKALEIRYANDEEVPLQMYLGKGIGSDRHQVLFAAFILERLIQQGVIKGKVYLDSCCQSDKYNQERLIYNSSSGYLYIFLPSE